MKGKRIFGIICLAAATSLTGCIGGKDNPPEELKGVWINTKGRGIDLEFADKGFLVCYYMSYDTYLQNDSSIYWPFIEPTICEHSGNWVKELHGSHYKPIFRYKVKGNKLHVRFNRMYGGTYVRRKAYTPFDIEEHRMLVEDGEHQVPRQVDFAEYAARVHDYYE